LENHTPQEIKAGETMYGAQLEWTVLAMSPSRRVEARIDPYNQEWPRKAAGDRRRQFTKVSSP